MSQNNNICDIVHNMCTILKCWPVYRPLPYQINEFQHTLFKITEEYEDFFKASLQADYIYFRTCKKPALMLGSHFKLLPEVDSSFHTLAWTRTLQKHLVWISIAKSEHHAHSLTPASLRQNLWIFYLLILWLYCHTKALSILTGICKNFRKLTHRTENFVTLSWLYQDFMIKQILLKLKRKQISLLLKSE